MKSLLTITSLVEGVTGLALALAPSVLVSILLGTSLTDPASILIGRLAGATLFSIAVACWLSRTGQSSIMVKAMLGYNIFSIAILVYAVLGERISGPGLWPAVLLHFGLLFWCVSTLWKQVNRSFKGISGL
jgi:hypothetical protein